MPASQCTATSLTRPTLLPSGSTTGRPRRCAREITSPAIIRCIAITSRRLVATPKTPSLLVCSVLIGHWPLLARCHRFPRTSLPPMVIVRHAAQTLRGLEEIVGAHPPSDQGPGSPGRVRLCRTRRTAGWPFHARSFLRSRLEQLPLRSLLPATRRGLLHQEGLTPLGGRVRGVLPPIARSGSHRAAPSS